MIKKIRLQNFKCFENLTLDLSNLNVFTGLNSMGKSTIIQSLLLLKQTYDLNFLDKGLYLNGELVSIGRGQDLLNQYTNEDFFSIGIENEEDTIEWKYIYDRDSEQQNLVREEEQSLSKEKIQSLNIFFPSFAYITAGRIGPKTFYQKSYHQVYLKNQAGYKGEFLADYLIERGEEKITNMAILHEKNKSTILKEQLKAWLSEISPNVNLTPVKHGNAGIVELEFNSNSTTNPYTPLNVGFGLSYIAPILLVLLKAKEGDLVILESPEAHIHPRGQRKIGELISKAAAGNVQVLIETHSDHILNGIRLSVKNKIIKSDKVKLNYFYQEIVQKDGIEIPRHQKSSPVIQDNGSLTDWPDGFFDEWTKAIDELF